MQKHQTNPTFKTVACCVVSPPVMRLGSLWFSLIFSLLLVLPVLTASVQAAVDQQSRFKEDVAKLAAVGDRSIGTAGKRAAAAYIRQQFEEYYRLKYPDVFQNKKESIERRCGGSEIG